MFLSEKSLKAQLRHRPVSNEKIEYLQCQLDGAFSKKCQAQKTADPLQRQLDTVRSSVNDYRQCFPEFTNHMRTDVTDGFIHFLFEILQEAQTLIIRPLDTINFTFKRDLDAVDDFLRSLKSELSLPGSSS